MFVRKFEGESLDETLQSVKRELGPDAIILKTVTNKGLKGSFKKSRIEITAAISEQSYEKKSRVDHVLNTEQQEQFYQRPATAINHMIDDYDGHRPRMNEEQSTPQAGGYGNIGLNKVVNTVSKASNKIKNTLDDFLAMETEDEVSNTQIQSQARSTFDKFVGEEQRQNQASLQQRQSQQPNEAVRNYKNEMNHLQDETHQMFNEEREFVNEVSSELKQQIKSQSHQIKLLESKLFELTEKLANTSTLDQSDPRGIKSLRTSLRSLEIEEGIIQVILKKASFELTREELDEADVVFEFALREINNMVNTDMPLFSNISMQDKPVITAIISENSCGQSSMAMKLAVLQEDVKIIRLRARDLDKVNSDFTSQVFNLDISTVETLAQLMSEVRKANHDGRSVILDLKFNFKEADETKKFIDTLKRSFDDLEILVNISAIHSEIYNRKILSKYKGFANGAIISYVDQCLSFGSILNLSYDFSALPLKFFGTGATVPDDIEAATAERILAGLFNL